MADKCKNIAFIVPVKGEKSHYMGRFFVGNKFLVISGIL